MARLLITGAAGNIGTMIAPKLQALGHELVLSDRLDDAEKGIVAADLGDYPAIARVMAGVDGVVHLGGMATEAPFETVLNANIRGTYHVFEAARQLGVRRIVLASSYHAVGMYPTGAPVDETSPLRPDSFYGLSKAYGEMLARTYHDKCGIQSLSIRIGSCFETVRSFRMLTTWISARDLTSMIDRAFSVDHLGCLMLYGVSNNARGVMQSADAEKLGWQAEDRSEDAPMAENRESDVIGPLLGGPFAEKDLPSVTDTPLTDQSGKNG
ncbi:NAD(P)-dependent oxidoreductase [Allorhizobium sp. BGMRC 0089]|uniref:NAD-dependent epimerase/dehydratase family protein n=1 Tax=Allorhizobium sonneratiae TaxID=2934936 RepID=UPI0020335EBF|nr:NAD(P)-dependent oxidoreductase [Allorhizobium sonneratiae]MCM2293089.1 NAD(P)-dependent oxidoreductase [Allorhizobium sonneratiae]